VTERMIEANEVQLCTESFGNAADPPILLVMGIGASMLWWEEGFCLLARGGRFVIRYDDRDTGRSVTYEPGHPEYTGADLVADALGVSTPMRSQPRTWSASRRAGRSRSYSRSTSPIASSRSSLSARLPRRPVNADYPRRPSGTDGSWRPRRWTGRTGGR
jgi:hypothetical protein